MRSARKCKAGAAADEGIFTDHAVFRGQSLKGLVDPDCEADDDDDDENKGKEGDEEGEKQSQGSPDGAKHWDREVALSKAKWTMEEEVATTQQYSELPLPCCRSAARALASSSQPARASEGSSEHP